MEGFEGALIAATGVSKHFGGVRALDNVSLEVFPAEIHALVGENGAGKSTLVKIMTGAETQDAGAIRVLGEDVGVVSPEKARRYGIGAVYQEPSLVPGLTVLENMCLARERHGRVGVLARKEMRRRATQALTTVGASVPLGEDVAHLSVADRQMVEIARALMHEARVLIFDEPSAILSGVELDRVFAVIQDLRRHSLGILYISHRLSEIFQLADRATVLKDGRVVTTRPVATLSTDELIRLMVGRDIGDRPPRKPPSDRVVLSVRDLQLRPHTEAVSFDLRAGEILGVAGLIGSSRSRLANALGGVRPARSGTVLRNGEPVRLRHPRDGARAGIAVIPEDRKGAGLILALSVRENVGLASLSRLSRFGVVRRREEAKLATDVVQRFRVRPSATEVLAQTLSGGNQQKVVLGKWLVPKPIPEVAVLDEPTRGVDVGAKFEIYSLIDELVTRGAGVVLISSELPELIAMSDRIMVMSAGHVVGMLDRSEFSEERILRLAVLGREAERAEAAEVPAS